MMKEKGCVRYFLFGALREVVCLCPAVPRYVLDTFYYLDSLGLKGQGRRSSCVVLVALYQMDVGRLIATEFGRREPLYALHR